MKQIILATNNQNKLREVREMLTPLGIEVLSQSEAGADIEVEETGVTFEENAQLKARAVFELTGLPCIADDSGLEVDYLNGAPGVYSARYAPENERCDKLLSELLGVPQEERSARFVSSICYVHSDGNSHTVRGTVEGYVGFQKLGTNGFGYDPVFMYGEKSFAEMSADEKNAVSHRAKALKLICNIIKAIEK